MSSTPAHLQTRGQYEYHIEPLDNMTTSAAIFDQLSIQICLDEDETRSGTLAQSRVLLDSHWSGCPSELYRVRMVLRICIDEKCANKW